MRTQEPKAILLNEYQAPEWTVDSFYLDFDLGDSHSIVTARALYSHISQTSGHSLYLQGEALELLSVTIDGELRDATQYEQSNEGLILHTLPASCEIVIKTKLYPHKNTSLDGLYQSSGNFCTQCEAQGFRKITYFLDRPDVMTRYTTRIEADKDTVSILLSNGNLKESGVLENNRHYAIWHDPYRKPTYLFALVAGDLEYVEDTYITASKRHVTLRIYTESHNIGYCDHAMASLKRAMEWDEQRFGLEYDLDIYMIVAVDDFNMGAMENKGLNLFNSRLVFASPKTATDNQYIDIEAVIGHEYFHNWTGNRVTCRDWFQLSLKEGLTVFRDQEFTSDLHSRVVKRIDDVRMLRNLQFEEDAGPMAHPIRPQSYIEINNFYTLTVYEKGAEVVRLYHTLLGEAGFRKGMDLYFKRFDGQAVTTEDFLSSMADANSTDLSQLQSWYDQAGTPELQVTMEYQEAQRQCIINIQQHCPATPESETKEPFLIPVVMGLVGQQGDIPLELSESSTHLAPQQHCKTQIMLPLNALEHRFVFNNVDEKPVPSLLRGFSAPVKLHYEYSTEDLIFLMRHDSDPFNRWEASQQLVLTTMLQLLEQKQKGQAYGLSHDFIEIFQLVLNDNTLDEALRAETLTLPGFTNLAEQIQEEVNPDDIIEVIDFIKVTLANSLRLDFESHYARLSQDTFTLDGTAISRRRLKNTCLSYLGCVDDDVLHQDLYSRFIQTDNMTDYMALFKVLVDLDSPLSQQAIDVFEEKWEHNAQVMDNWFVIQAGSKRSDTIERVQELTQHSAFNFKNPNKVRSLLGAFSRNYRYFHQKEGAGYRLLTESVEVLDQINPQVASRLVKPLINWKSLEPDRSKMMQQCLRRLRDKLELSKDVFEIVDKALK